MHATKQCTRCDGVFDLAQFHKNRRAKDGRSAHCRDCAKAYQAKMYQKHKKKRRNRINEWQGEERLRRLEWAEQYFTEHPCVDCGERDPVVLEFDHVVPGKTACVSKLLWGFRPMKLVEKEVAKCVVRCANCHRRKTARTLGWGRYRAAA